MTVRHVEEDRPDWTERPVFALALLCAAVAGITLLLTLDRVGPAALLTVPAVLLFLNVKDDALAGHRARRVMENWTDHRNP